MVRYVDPLGHIILIPSQPSDVLIGKATNTNSIVFGLTRSGLEPTTYRHRGEHDNPFTTDAVRIHIEVYSIVIYLLAIRGSRGSDRMVVRFEHFYVISPIINNV